MKTYALLDNKISDGQVETFSKEWSAFIKKHTGLTPVITALREDYTNYPVVPDADGDMRPTDAFLKALTTKVDALVGEYGTDHIFVFIHRDNWKSPGIWGTNFSYKYGNHHVHYCRWDSQNMANTFGTAYHEWMHSLDSLVMSETGTDIESLFEQTACWSSWDGTVVHGNRFVDCKKSPYTYIRWQENTDALQYVAQHLIEAYSQRRKKELIAKNKTLLGLLTLWLEKLLRIKKDGVGKGV